jgi:beta-glucosidase
MNGQKLVNTMIGCLAMLCLINIGIAQSATDMNAKVDSLLGKMTLQEKIGQMTQLTLQAVSARKQSAQTQFQLDPIKLKQVIVDYHVGSLLNSWESSLSLWQWQQLITTIQDVATKQTRLGIPIVYGIDAVHGQHFLQEATVFPHNLALAATWDLNHVRAINRITAMETRASGIPWNFAPVLDVARQPLWSRFFETFGEDPYLVEQMGLAAIKGLQGEGALINKDRVAACGKHFLGYSVPLSGKDRTPAWIPERQLREYFLPPFKAAIEAGVMSLMINSGEINGIPVHANKRLLTDLLRDELGFDGVAVSDWEDIIKLHTVHRIAKDERHAVKLAILAGIDMSMTPYTLAFHDYLLDLVQKGEITEARIDTSVRRILKMKYRLGLFDNPYPNVATADNIGSAESLKVSQNAAEDAITLLKNTDNLLPLSKHDKILLTGPGAASLPALHGAWSYSWQGNDKDLYPQTTKTVLQVLRGKVGADKIKYVPGASYFDVIDLGAVRQAAQNVEVIIVAIAEKPAVEQLGIIEDLRLPAAQIDLVRAAQSTGKPVVLLLLENRPRIISEIEPDAQAILMAYYPGMFGAAAIVKVLYGEVNPSGKLPFTYPRFSGSTEVYNHKVSESQELAYAWTAFNPQWTFGYGLSYTSFVYSDLRLDKQEMSAEDSLNVSVTVHNTGERPGKEVVQLYLRDMYASITPVVKKLVRFKKIALDPQQSEQVNFIINQKDLSFIGMDNKRIVEPGQFQVMVDSLALGFKLKQ